MDVSLALRALFWLNVAISLATSNGESSIDQGNRPIFAHRPIKNARYVDKTSAMNRIVAGTPVAQGTIPGLGMVILSDFSGVSLVSTGTLITPIYLLTSAQNLYPNNNAAFLRLLRVYFNTANVNPIDSDTIIRGVAELKIHPQYTPPSSQFVRNDVALVKLDAPVLTIPTIRLASVANLFANRPATIYGFGMNHTFDATPATLSSTLLKGSLTVLSSEQCTKTFGSQVTSQHLCAAGSQPPCVGDLGSPLIVDGLQVAMILESDDRCDPSGSAVFTRVQYFYDWIKANSNLL